MENIKMEDIVEETTSTSEEVAETTETKETEVVEQDPLKTELERVRTVGKTEKEKAEYSLKKNAERVKALGGDPTQILGFKEEQVSEEDDRPVTIGMLKRMQEETTAKTALQMAEEISNETERELVKYHLQNTIRSTGTPAQDLKLARALVNSVKNSQILEETARKTAPKTHSNASGVDAKQEKEVAFTPDEQRMMAPPFNVSPAEILEARKGKTFSFKHAKK